MLNIDRVQTDMEVVPSVPAASAGSAASGADVPGGERLRALVLDVLSEHLRELERRGVL